MALLNKRYHRGDATVRREWQRGGATSAACLFRSAGMHAFLAQLHCVLVDESVWRKLQVLRRRAQTHAACVVVVRAMARAKVAAPIASVRLWDATQVRADADDDEPIGLLASLRICCWITH